MEYGGGSKGRGPSWFKVGGSNFRWAVGTTDYRVKGKRWVSMSTGFGIESRTRGYRNVEEALIRAIFAIKGRSAAGLLMATELLRENMEKIPPTVPISNENKIEHLKDTFFSTLRIDPDGDPNIEIGYSAPYAFYVHEMTEPPYDNIHWTQPGSGPKWFEIAIQRDKFEMLKIITENIKMVI